MVSWISRKLKDSALAVTIHGGVDHVVKSDKDECYLTCANAESPAYSPFIKTLSHLGVSYIFYSVLTEKSLTLGNCRPDNPYMFPNTLHLEENRTGKFFFSYAHWMSNSVLPKNLIIFSYFFPPTLYLNFLTYGKAKRTEKQPTIYL